MKPYQCCPLFSDSLIATNLYFILLLNRPLTFLYSQQISTNYHLLIYLFYLFKYSGGVLKQREKHEIVLIKGQLQ